MAYDSSWSQVAHTLAREVEALSPGARLPTHRQLVDRFGVSATTVSRALAHLVQEGLVESRPGAGSFRAAPAPIPMSADTRWQEASLGLSPTVGTEPTPSRDYDASALGATLQTWGADVIDLNGGYLHPDLQPRTLLTAALASAGRRTEAWERPDPAGLAELRDRFAATIGGGLTRHDMLVTAGGQVALSIVMRALGKPGDPVVVETPTYPGTLAAARGAGLRTIPVPLDEAGLRADLLDRALEQTGARIVVVQPHFQNPTGVSLSPSRRLELLDVVVARGAFLVEDDFARDLVHADDAALPALAASDEAGAVLHVRSLTKATSPNMRVAALAGRGPVMARLRAAHVVETMFVPAVLQHTALELLSAPGWSRARRTLSRALLERRTAAVEAARRVLGDCVAAVPRGGFHLWVRLPPGVEDRAFASAALRNGVAVTPGSNYHPAGEDTGHVRLSYVAAPSVADLVAGIERLGAQLTPIG